MPTLLHPDDPAFHRMVAAFEGPAEPWLEVNRTLRDATASYAAERSPYYRSMVRPGMSFEDIPILTKQTVRERYDDLLAEGVHRDRWVERRTSGSTGTPMPFARDTAQGYLENLSARRFLLWMQDIPPDITAVWVAARPVGDLSPRAGFLRRRLGLGRDPEIHAVSTLGLTPAGLSREVRTWDRFRAYFLYGHASAIGWIADQVSRGVVESVRPTCVVTTSDVLTENIRHRITEAFRVPIHSWYGSNEMNGFVGGTLPGTTRFALNPLLVYAEVVDEGGRPVPPGETGRLILTDLNNLVMPFIRYDTSDLAILSPSTAGGFPILEALVGRGSELIRLPNGRMLNAVTLGHALFVAGDFVQDVAGYQCARTAPAELELRVVWARGPSPERERALAEACRPAMGPGVSLRVLAVDRLETHPSGKAWILRDETAMSPEESEAG
jgi:phenylacetate-CoA ligase